MTHADLLAIYNESRAAFLGSLAALGRDDHAEYRRLWQRHEELSETYLQGWLKLQEGRL